eukprot:1159098-Pelagomonas_calceolata.AAC.5
MLNKTEGGMDREPCTDECVWLHAGYSVIGQAVPTLHSYTAPIWRIFGKVLHTVVGPNMIPYEL